MSVPSPDAARGARPMLAIRPELVDDETAVVALSGEVDLWSSPQLKRTLCDLLAEGRKRLVLDLTEVRFMDSTALGVLVGVDRRLAGDQHLALASPGAEVLRVLELSGVASGFRIFPTTEAALAHVSLDCVERADSAQPPLTADAALLLGIAATAMPFAQSVEEQAERWLRALRRHGEAGAVLASLGVQEAPVSRIDDASRATAPCQIDPDPVSIVIEHAGHIAAERGSAKLSTNDVLRAVVHVYGETFARVVAAHGVTLHELVERLESQAPAGAESHA